jgi:hypothetical protein
MPGDHHQTTASEHFGEPQSITCDAAHCIMDRAQPLLQAVMLVGGFSASDYLFSELRRTVVESMGIELCRPDRHGWVGYRY